MANTYTQCYFQLVFADKNRNSLIKESWKNELEMYITGIVQNHKHKLLAINAMPDHIHILIGINKPLRNLIAVGRNKGLSIILATQNMDSYKSEYFDFYANAQYPLIMKQQSINDGVIKNLFGVSGNEFNEIKQAISGLQKGELIVKDPLKITIEMGKKYKKIKVSHLI